MNLDDVKKLAIAKIAEHGLTGWSFEFDRSRRRAGCCKHRRMVISLSAALTAVAPVSEVLDTILHEIAHALTPGHRHDYVWQRKAREIGCDGRRCYSDDNKPGDAQRIAVAGELDWGLSEWTRDPQVQESGDQTTVLLPVQSGVRP